jgi:hypothetical protein
LPILPLNIEGLIFENNIIYEIVNGFNKKLVIKNLKIINKFRKLYYLIKIKNWLIKHYYNKKIDIN